MAKSAKKIVRISESLMGVVNYRDCHAILALLITCRGIFSIAVAFEQAFMVALSLLAFLPLADYSKFSLVSSPLAAAARRTMNIKRLRHVRRIVISVY